MLDRHLHGTGIAQDDFRLSLVPEEVNIGAPVLGLTIISRCMSHVCSSNFFPRPKMPSLVGSRP